MRWLIAFASIFAAVLIHELGHYVVLRLYNVRVYGVSFFGFHYAPNGNPEKLEALERHFGIGIIRDIGTKHAELLSSLAGPFVNLIAALIMAEVGTHYPMLAFPFAANMAVGLYNLLPVPGSDGLRFIKTLFGTA